MTTTRENIQTAYDINRSVKQTTFQKDYDDEMQALLISPRQESTSPAIILYTLSLSLYIYIYIYTVTLYSIPYTQTTLYTVIQCIIYYILHMVH